jgi:uncharacterized tellurite resistance protein B-like protein
MIGALKALFDMPERESEESKQHRLNVAAAAMLIETAQDEQAAMKTLLSGSLGLPATEVQELMETASNRVDEATSLYEFTRIINDHYSAQQKVQLIGAMWAVAFADGNLDKYEEALIRQVAELTYVPHQDYIRCKLAAAG